MGFRKSFSKGVPESAREEVLAAVRSGLSPAAAATVAGVSATTGYVWAGEAGWRAGGGHTGIRYSAAVREAFWAAMRSGCSTRAGGPDRRRVGDVGGDLGQTGWLHAQNPVPRSVRDRVVSAPACAAARSPNAVGSRTCLRSAAPRCGPPNCSTVTATRFGREIVKGLTARGIGPESARTRRTPTASDPRRASSEAQACPAGRGVARLEARHSPEQIAERLRQDFPDDPEMWVSHETIYQALYVQPRGELARLVKTALRTGRTRRKAQGRKGNSQGKLKGHDQHQ